MIILDNLPLKSSSSSIWLDRVMDDFNLFLLDHAACERKASALAMSFIVKYPDRKYLLEPMIALAREELAHFHEVYRLIQKRNLTFTKDEKDPYINKMLSIVRNGRENHFLDRLIVSSVIEARGCERFYAVSKVIKDLELQKYYGKLAREEAGHYKIFLNIAHHYFTENEVKERLEEILWFEKEAISSIPIRAAVH